jgi:hypothetical protein
LDAALRIVLAELGDQRGNRRAIGQSVGHHRFGYRIGGGEYQRLQQAQMVRIDGFGGWVGLVHVFSVSRFPLAAHR